MRGKEVHRVVKRDFHDAVSPRRDHVDLIANRAAAEDGPIGFRGRRGDIGPGNLDARCYTTMFPIGEGNRGVGARARAREHTYDCRFYEVDKHGAFIGGYGPGS